MLSVLNLNNSKKASLFSTGIILLILSSSFLPFIIIKFIPHSVIGNYILKYIHYMYLIIPFAIYFYYTGIYYYYIKIDPYIINLRSHRAILDTYKKSNYIDISHTMLDSFSFFNRPFSFNRTLMIKIKTESGKKIAKRFNLSFLKHKEEEKITKRLNQIIANRKDD